ncbi:unnamed protein product [Calypogeia fissa]
MVETMPRMSSTLNPNAPLFVPASYLATEDFSPEWWHLIQTSPAFRDYWLIERSEIFEESDDAAAAAALDDMDDFEDFLDIEFQGEEAENAGGCKQDNVDVRDIEKEVLSALAGLGVNDLKSQQRIWREPVKHQEKILNKSPRSPRNCGTNQFRIQQPRA